MSDAEEIRLTPRVKKVIKLAIDEARNLHHNYIGTEHLLLGRHASNRLDSLAIESFLRKRNKNRNLVR